MSNDTGPWGSPSQSKTPNDDSASGAFLKLVYFIHLPWFIVLALMDGHDYTGILIWLASITLCTLAWAKSSWISEQIDRWTHRGGSK